MVNVVYSKSTRLWRWSAWASFGIQQWHRGNGSIRSCWLSWQSMVTVESPTELMHISRAPPQALTKMKSQWTTISMKLNKEEVIRRLGFWVKRQRYEYKLYRKGDPSSDMTPNRIGLLDDLMFEWTVRSNTWMDYYQELKAYADGHGNSLVPCSMKQLNEWTNEQRHQFRVYQENRALSNITDEQAKLVSGVELA
jgi:Helicase associated domain